MLLLLGLLAPSQTLARAHSASCRRSASAHPKRRGRACPRPARAKIHARHGTERSGAGPAVTKTKVSTDATAGSSASPRLQAARSQLTATCADGSEPAPLGEETFACGDGSEPSCKDGSSFEPSSDGSKLLCDAAPGPGSGSGEVGVTCAEGAEPVGGGDGSASCEATGEPSAESGGEASGEAGSEGSGEAGGEAGSPASVAIQLRAGPSPHAASAS